MMRTLSLLVFALALSSAAASAQSRGVLAMHVGPAPEYRMSVGIVVPERDRLMMRARIEWAPDCTPAGVAAADVTEDQVFPMTEIGAGETPEAYGDVHAAAYDQRVTALGGASAPEYLSCVRTVMTQRGTSQLERR